MRHSPDLPPIDANDVRELKSLPEGLGFSAKDTYLHVAKDFPSSAAPHRVLGVFLAPFDRHDDAQSGATNDRIRNELKKNAATLAGQHGANAYVLQGFDLWVVRLSTASPQFPTADKALQARNFVPARFKQTAVTKRRLDAWRPVRVFLKKHECYGLSWALSPDASVDLKQARRAALWWFEAASGKPSGPPKKGGLPLGLRGPGLAQRAYFVDMGCTGSDMAIDLKLNVQGRGEVEVRTFIFRPSANQRKSACTLCLLEDGLHDEKCLVHRNLTSGICR